MSSSPYKNILLRVPFTLWHRAKLAAARHSVQGGVTSLARRGLEAELRRLEHVPATFMQAWREAHPQDDYYATASAAERVACYGGRPYTVQANTGALVGAELFTHTELLAHYNSDTWTKRTAELVFAQRAHWRSVGVTPWVMPLCPPGWDEVVREAGAQDEAWQVRVKDEVAPANPEDDII